MIVPKVITIDAIPGPSLSALRADSTAKGKLYRLTLMLQRQ